MQASREPVVEQPMVSVASAQVVQNVARFREAFPSRVSSSWMSASSRFWVTRCRAM